MRAPPILAALTPAGRALLAVVAAALIIALAHAAGLRWDPFDLAGRRLRAAETRADAALADAGARRLEAAAAAGQAQRVDRHLQQTVAVERATARAAAQARSAPDAAHPLDPDRVARLAGHDRQLCRLAPAVCRPAAADPAPGGDDVLPAGPSA